MTRGRMDEDTKLYERDQLLHTGETIRRTWVCFLLYRFWNNPSFILGFPRALFQGIMTVIDGWGQQLVALIYKFSGICRQLRKIWRNVWSRDSSVGIATELWIGRSSYRIPVEGEIFRTRPVRFWVPPSIWYNKHRVSFPRVKRPQCEADHPIQLVWRLKEE